MKRIDQSPQIMKSIATYERLNIRKWIVVFFTVLAVFAVSIMAVGMFIVRDLEYKKTFDVLQILQEDPEIIKMFLPDAVSVFMSEFPVSAGVAGLLLISGIVFFVVRSRQKRMKIRKISGWLDKNH